ncbi:helix-turn-helix transcriptional regulator [Sporomusa sp.]|uniref:helix-turn-helix domain-containing protein n=1 Tax=Sporomusa sp. TaxID=2078658 RepID=UPI002CB2A78F|nr:helix-turn-helix transcriptional regulator [Sporomusa sp.]HWR45290.1 helix-turn-helix transcriptional regulator [Sporomusa sp.]
MTIKERIKPLLDNQGITIEELAIRLNWSSRALHNKLSRDSMKYYDVEKILDVLGYDITWKLK